MVYFFSQLLGNYKGETHSLPVKFGRAKAYRPINSGWAAANQPEGARQATAINYDICRVNGIRARALPWLSRPDCSCLRILLSYWPCGRARFGERQRATSRPAGHRPNFRSKGRGANIVLLHRRGLFAEARRPRGELSGQAKRPKRRAGYGGAVIGFLCLAD